MTCTLQVKWELEGYIPKLKGQCSVEWQNSGTFCVKELGSGNQNNSTELDRETEIVPFKIEDGKLGEDRSKKLQAKGMKHSRNIISIC